MTRRLGYVLKRYPRISETFVVAEILELERQGEDVVVFAVSRPDEPFRHAFVDNVRAPVVYLPHRPWRQPLRVGRAVVRALRSDARGFGRAVATLCPPRSAGLRGPNAVAGLRGPNAVAGLRGPNAVIGLRRLLQAAVLLDEMHRAGITHAHAHFATTAARITNLAWRMGGPSYSVTVHAKDVWHREVQADHLRDKLAPARFVATVSPLNRSHISGVLGDGAGARVHLVPNAVDVDRLTRRTLPPEPMRVFTAARLVPKKGIADLVEGCRLLAERGVEVDLEVIGDGPLLAALRRTAASGGVRARFRGALPHDDVLDRMRQAQVFCLPCVVADDGDRDGLPTAVLEAMALGVPVVTTAVNGLAEAVIDGRTGLVVPQRDPVAVAAALHRVLADDELAAHLAAGARRHVEERFALRRSVDLLRSLFPEAS